MAEVVFVIAQKDFRDEELLITKDVLEKNNIKCIVASKERGKHKGMLGEIVESDLSINEISDFFEGIVFVGGVGAKQYFNDALVLALAKKYYSIGKIVCAICIAPSILANSGILKGKKATAFNSEKENLVSKGAIFTGKAVEIDGTIITADGPKSAKAFGEAIAKKLKN